MLPGRSIQGAQAEVTVGLERAHAELLGEGKGLLVVGCGLGGLWRRTVHCDLTEEPQGVGGVAPFLVRLGELQRPLRLRPRFIQPARPKVK